MNIGDLVIIKNEKNKIIYIIEEIKDDFVCLKGYTHRIKKYLPLSEIKEATFDLIEQENKKVQEYQNKIKKEKLIRNSIKPLFGRILHIDGDPNYLNSCLLLYKEMGLSAEGIYIKEEDMPKQIEKIVKYLTPDIVVITGHDVYSGKDLNDINSYQNTKIYMDVIRKIRKNYLIDDVCIIAGACGSFFEALIASGANFASSPKRINIHTYDPAVIAIKVATTSINKTVDFGACVKLIEEGRSAFGGIETKGKMRLFV